MSDEFIATASIQEPGDNRLVMLSFPTLAEAEEWCRGKEREGYQALIRELGGKARRVGR